MRPTWLGMEDIQDDGPMPDWDKYAKQQADAINEVYNQIVRGDGMQLTNVIVQDAKMVKSGVGEYGPWELWNLTINGKKYGHFRHGDEDLSIGREIALMEFDEKPSRDGRFKNLSITKMIWADVPPAGYPEPQQEPPQDPVPKPLGKPTWDDVPRSMLLSYIKDLQVVRIQTSPVLADVPLAKLWREVEDVASGKEIPF